MRVFSSAFLYGNKVIPFEQPILSANGVIGGDSFAVCAKEDFEAPYNSRAYVLSDGSSEKLDAENLLFGIYNPKLLRINSIDVYGSGFWEAINMIDEQGEPARQIVGSNNMEVFATNDYDEFMNVFVDYNFHEIQQIDYENDIEILEKTFNKREDLAGVNVTATGVRSRFITIDEKGIKSNFTKYYKYYCFYFPRLYMPISETFYEIEIDGAEKIKGV